jgi:DNA-binding NarL/FixJ family response regulator
MKENGPIRVLLAEDHELIRTGIGALFQTDTDLQLVDQADNFADTLRLAKQICPDLILLNMTLKDGETTSRIPELQSVSPSSKILILTASESRDKHLLALRIGAMGIFTKNQPNSMLIKAIRSVCSGEVWLNRSLAAEMLRDFNRPPSSNETDNKPKTNLLTPRELSIARLAAKGWGAKKISGQLFISEKTVRNQLVIIYSKLGVSSHVELVVRASHFGLLSPDL